MNTIMKLNGGFKLFVTLAVSVFIAHAVMDYTTIAHLLPLWLDAIIELTIVIPLVYTSVYFAYKRPMEKKLSLHKTLRTPDACLMDVIDNSHVVVFKINRDGIIVMAEGGGLRNLGLTTNDCVGKKAVDFWEGTPSAECVTRALAGEKIIRTMRIDDVYLKSFYLPVEDGIAGVCMDITTELTNRSYMTELRSMTTKFNTTELVSKDVMDKIKRMTGAHNE